MMMMMIGRLAQERGPHLCLDFLSKTGRQSRRQAGRAGGRDPSIHWLEGGVASGNERSPGPPSYSSSPAVHIPHQCAFLSFLSSAQSLAAWTSGCHRSTHSSPASQTTNYCHPSCAGQTTNYCHPSCAGPNRSKIVCWNRLILLGC